MENSENDSKVNYASLKKILNSMLLLSLKYQNASYFLVRSLAVLGWLMIFVGFYLYLGWKSDLDDPFIIVTSLTGFILFGIPYFNHIIKGAESKLMFLQEVYLENLDDDLIHPLSKL